MAVLRNSLFFAGTSGESSSVELHRHTLEPRWTNPFDAADVNDDGVVAPLDALLILNELTDRRFVDANGMINVDPVEGLQLDANVDGHISPVDALLAINGLDSGTGSARNASARLSNNEPPDVARNATVQDATSVFITVELDEEADGDQHAVLIDIVFGFENQLFSPALSARIFTLSVRASRLSPDSLVSSPMKGLAGRSIFIAAH